MPPSPSFYRAPRSSVNCARRALSKVSSSGWRWFLSGFGAVIGNFVRGLRTFHFHFHRPSCCCCCFSCCCCCCCCYFACLWIFIMRVVVGTTLDNFWPDKNTKRSTNFYFDVVSFTCHSGTRSQAGPEGCGGGGGCLERGRWGRGSGSNIGPGDLGSWLKSIGMPTCAVPRSLSYVQYALPSLPHPYPTHSPSAFLVSLPAPFVVALFSTLL